MNSAKQIRSTALLTVLLSLTASAQVLDVWIGTRHRTSKGIYHTTLNEKNGRLGAVTVAAEIAGPGFLAMHPDRKTLYAVGALDNKPCVAAYRISGKKGSQKLTFLNSMDIGDGGAAHVAVDKRGKTLITAQYGGGSVAVFALNTDGSVRARTQLIEHEGASMANERRQKAPHPHWTGFSPDDRFAFIPDLGLDKVVVYSVENGKLSPAGSATLHSGAGPRHMKFHTSGKYAYVLNELDLTVTAFNYNKANASMKPFQKIAAVPAAELEKEKSKSASEIRVHPSGKFVYSANRGHDTITAYRVDQRSGKLEVVEREFVRGATPRNFNLDPSGKWMIAAGQNSFTLAAFEVDQQTGELAYNGSVVNCPGPICVLFTHE
ncbi:MAG: 3-carboxymuconate cyclase [Verrucomicrobiales bacterium]|nr:3-carboxymuconate cyclase [Verrucomicrobiales bacterium]|tara:strand:- start:10471 stop:11601 length:1131 start_codon:yes stop_codon:yes gene_type:complete